MTEPAVANASPYVSVLMPIRNEAAFIERGLKAVLRQDYPAERMEVIVADGMSTDGTREIVSGMAVPGRPSPVQIVDNPGLIVPTGMNAALGKARGEIIIRVDGHCEIAPDYVLRCVEHLQSDGVDGVGGPVATLGETGLAQTIALAMSSRFGVGDSAFRTSSPRTMLVDTVPFPAYTREIIERAGMYDEELVRNQDDEYNYRIRELGGKILLASDVRSRYYSRSSLCSLWRQYFQYGYWKVRVLQKHPRQMRPRQFVPPAFVLALICSVLLALTTDLRSLSVVVPLTYIIANLAASVWTAVRKGWRHLPLLPVVFGILHASYGLGFLVGLVRFFHRWGDRHGRMPPWPHSTSRATDAS